MRNVGRILVVLFHVCHVGAKYGIIVLRPVKHFDQPDIEIVMKIHVGIRLHTKIVHLDGLKIELVTLILVLIIPRNHGAESGSCPGRSLRLGRIDRNDSHLVLIFLAVGIVLVAVSIPTTLVIFQVTIDLGLLNNTKGQSFRILGTCKRIVECSGTEFVAKGGNQKMDRNILGFLWVEIWIVVLVVVVWTFVRGWANCGIDIDFSKGSIRKESVIVGIISSQQAGTVGMILAGLGDSFLLSEFFVLFFRCHCLLIL